MARRRRPAPARAEQPDLLGWRPPDVVERFKDERVRAASIAGRVSRAVSETLRDCGLPRDEVARRMSDFLGDGMSKNVLDAYASEARAEHIINLVRFIALLDATRDRRLLEMIAEMFGWVVVERRYTTLINLAAVREKRAELGRQDNALTCKARAAGLL